MSTPAQYDIIINDYSSQFPGILNDFMSAFKNHMKNPGDSEITAVYTTKSGNMDKIVANMFVTNNGIQTDINTIYTALSGTGGLNSKISSKKSNITLMQQKLADFIGSGNSSSTLIDNTIDRYKFQYMSNVLLILGIFLILWMLFKIFRNTGASTSTSTNMTAASTNTVIPLQTQR